jgi:dTDP-4-amino-4,6-dideoxy-D-galactose acyltransferase
MSIDVIERLEWDSQFFGYPVARIVFDQQGCDNLDDLFRQLISEKIRLTYFYVPVSETKLNGDITKKGGNLVDQKTLYSKMTGKHNNFSDYIFEFQGTQINERLKELVLQAGLFSRFHSDKNFINKEYEKLYTEWLAKSLNKILALKTVIAKKDSDIVGLTTVGERSGHADIGLVAVDENFRGQGIGYDLIHFADNAAFDLGYNEIKVVTQLQNKGACRLYEKCNFHIENITNIYHYWR